MRRKPITGIPDGKPLTHATLKQIHKGLQIANEEFNKRMAEKLFGRLAEEPEVKRFIKDHFIIESVPLTRGNGSDRVTPCRKRNKRRNA